MTEQQIQDNIADAQPERQAEGQAIERARDVSFNTTFEETALETCLRESDNYNDFCQKCNKLLNKQDALPIDLWNEYWERYKE